MKIINLHRISSILLLFSIVLFSCQKKADKNPGQTEIDRDSNALIGKQVLVTTNIKGKVLDGYWLYLPKGHSSSKKWPVIMFLAGGGSIGSELTPQNSWGPAKYIQDESSDPLVKSYVMDSFILVTPHMKAGEFWERQWYDQHEALMDIISQLQIQFNSDPSRVYVTGASRGGHGTWGLAAKAKNKIAAIVPIAGDLHGVKDFSVLVNIPIWVIHNTGDQIVDYGSSAMAVSEIEKFGIKFLNTKSLSLVEKDLGNANIFTSLQSEDHNAWDDVYKNVNFYKWLMQFRSE